MRWKILSLILLCIVLLQCGEDSLTPDDGNAQPVGVPVDVTMYEFANADELQAFVFPTDTKGAIAFRVERIDDTLVPARATPIFLDDGQHAIDDAFLNTRVLRIFVFR